MHLLLGFGAYVMIYSGLSIFEYGLACLFSISWLLVQNYGYQAWCSLIRDVVVSGGSWRGDM